MEGAMLTDVRLNLDMRGRKGLGPLLAAAVHKWHEIAMHVNAHVRKSLFQTESYSQQRLM